MKQTASQRIYRELFEVSTSSQYRKKVLFFPIPPQFPYSVKLLFRHFYHDTSQRPEEQLTIKYPHQYPKLAPSIEITSKPHQIPQVILKSPLLQPQAWSIQTRLFQILANLYQMIDSYWQCCSGFGKNLPFIGSRQQNINVSIASYKSSLWVHNQESKLQNLLTIQLAIICSQMLNFAPNSTVIQIINNYGQKRIGGFETIRRLLKVSELRQRLRQELADGRWVHRILKSTMSIRYKKQLIRCQTNLFELIQQFQDQPKMIQESQQKQHV